jgi:DNA (cytosine-5)-methyltransferase 1
MKLIDLCCGAGGLSIGMIMAGHSIVAAFDNDDTAVETYRVNLGEHVHKADITTLRGCDLPDCDGIIGGPPCQPFSNGHGNIYTKKGPSDTRNVLPDFVRIVCEKRPRFFMFENVPGLLQYSEFLAAQLARLFHAGYLVVPVVLNAWRYGVPQERRRLFIAGYLDNLPIWPGQTSTRRNASARVAIQHLLVDGDSRPIPSWITKKITLQGDMIVDTRNRSYTRLKGRYFHARSIDDPSYTVMATERPGSKIAIIGSKSWPLGAKHNSVLQSFPDWFKWPPRHEDAQRLIGNAVPPLLSYAIGQALDK